MDRVFQRDVEAVVAFTGISESTLETSARRSDLFEAIPGEGVASVFDCRSGARVPHPWSNSPLFPWTGLGHDRDC